MIRTLVLFGATGDLAKRYLFPALGALEAAKRLPEGFHVIGGARDILDEEGVRQLAGDDIPAHMWRRPTPWSGQWEPARCRGRC